MRLPWIRNAETPNEPPPPLGPPPNYPDPVPLEWCIERQKRVVGGNWRLCYSLVESSARELKDEIDFSREQARARVAQFTALRQELQDRIRNEHNNDVIT